MPGVPARIAVHAAPTIHTPDLLPASEDFLELSKKGKRGRLKLYIGFAAGVGHDLSHAGKSGICASVVAWWSASSSRTPRGTRRPGSEGFEVIPRRPGRVRGGVEEMCLNRY